MTSPASQLEPVVNRPAQVDEEHSSCKTWLASATSATSVTIWADCLIGTTRIYRLFGPERGAGIN